MSLIKSFSVGDGDFFYIRHGSDNFTIIDCHITEDRERDLLAEVEREASRKGIVRFISTHPHRDHILGLEKLDDEIGILNFYRVSNSVASDGTPSFDCYVELRDDEKKSFAISKGCKRRWMNLGGEDRNGEYRGAAGISILWPDEGNSHFKTALKEAEDQGEPNNVCPIIEYSREDGVTCIWMGDLETEFMEKIAPDLSLPKTDILFAPHHGRSSGRVPKKLLDMMDPKLIVVGEAPSKDLEYYAAYNTITQNSAGDIEFECRDWAVDVFVSSETYAVKFLKDESASDRGSMHYIGTLEL